MTVFDTRGTARVNPLSLVMLIAVIVLMLLLVWSLLGDLIFINSAGQQLLPGEVFEQFRLADPPTTPVTTAG
jgi:hypothetical protein